MRLLNTESLEFEEFFDSQIPKYAILSHRWGNEEVTYQEFRKGKRQDKQGYAKIRQCCALAGKRGFGWVWIDTCCIDKKSSAELSEAINSMYRWYSNAGECYAYLRDVVWDNEDCEASKLSFRRSLWFTRGWTLQELLAPSSVMFLDRQWRFFGTKEDLAREISAVTGISIGCMDDPWSACAATKMSWVSRRATSRVEDMAYCMLGLFEVNMPLLYGEGKKAFLRLQLEIIKQSDDETIFAWTSREEFGGMLASEPSFFAQSGDLVNHPGFGKQSKYMMTRTYMMTNKGLEFQVPYRMIPEGKLSFALDCHRRDGGVWRVVRLELAKFPWGWQRINCQELTSGVQELTLGKSMTAEMRDRKGTALIRVPQHLLC